LIEDIKINSSVLSPLADSPKSRTIRKKNLLLHDSLQKEKSDHESSQISFSFRRKPSQIEESSGKKSLRFYPNIENFENNSTRFKQDLKDKTMMKEDSSKTEILKVENKFDRI
jgi:hypothetical protein